jgi:hypothetical protein
VVELVVVIPKLQVVSRMVCDQLFPTRFLVTSWLKLPEDLLLPEDVVGALVRVKVAVPA